MKKKIIFFSLAALLAIVLIFWNDLFETKSEELIFVKPKKGEFIISVTATGELRAKKSINIEAPPSARYVGIWNMRISRIVPEGTVVDSGDFVAELDKTELSNKIKDENLKIEELSSQLRQAKLDSSLELSAARDRLEDLKFDLETQKLSREQSKYEAPAIVRQAEINYEKALRNYKHALKSYKTKLKKQITNISIVAAKLEREKLKLAKLTKAYEEFTIKSPDSGIVIYYRDWAGRKRQAGSQINVWNNAVATLPDLSRMQAVVYVSEIDVQKVKTNLKAKIKLDAMPAKTLTGKVVDVANVGERLENSDAKVFQTIIDIDQKDSTLLPGMTVSAEIISQKIPNAIYIPIECARMEKVKGKKVRYVFVKTDGSLEKREVKLGKSNDTHVIVEEGLSTEDEIALSEPRDPSKYEFVFLSKKKQ